MISFEDAFEQVMKNTSEFGTETVSLDASVNHVLAEPVFADRDFPPFDRATKDGIAIQFAVIEKGLKALKVEGVAQAGSPRQTLSNHENCIEIMTGAMLPKNADTVIMYEHLRLDEGKAIILKPVKKGQNIHTKGTDEGKGNKVLERGTYITAAEIGVLAAVGKSRVRVKIKPKITVVSTGNELVEVDQTPKPHQIRKSNSHTLAAALKSQGIEANKLHLEDEPSVIKNGIKKALKENDVLLLSGGVSKGKFDFLPKVFDQLGVEKIFHRVKQRPGKPFWFGKHAKTATTLFAFPGNPGSTFASYHLYFLPWLYKSMGMTIARPTVFLEDSFVNETDFTRFIRAFVNLKRGKLNATLVLGNGSGDLTSLTKANGFVLLEPKTKYSEGDLVPFYPTKQFF